MIILGLIIICMAIILGFFIDWVAALTIFGFAIALAVVSFLIYFLDKLF